MRRLALWVLASVPAVAASECRFSLGTDALPMDDLVVVPSEVTLPVGGVAAVEGIGRDVLGGRVTVRVAWESADPGVAAVAPRLASHTVITAVGPGETVVTATHRASDATDTVFVTVTSAAREP